MHILDLAIFLIYMLAIVGFGISFSFEEILKMKNVGELIEIINNKGI